MLRLRQITFGKRVAITLGCPWMECAKKMDVDLDLDQISIEPKPIAPQYALTLSQEAALLDGEGRSHRSLFYRIPNGADQEAARGWINLDEPDRAVRLLRRCLLKIGEIDTMAPDRTATLSPQVIEEITAAMEQSSPQVQIEMEAHCPECGAPSTHLFEIVPYFLTELLQGCAQLEREIHLLGFYYHWPLRDILGMTLQKRKRYLQLLSDELARSGRSAVEVG
jgi:hypothetical protein